MKRCVDIITMGCSKNLVDSEMMLGMLSDNGYGITNDESQADIVVVNTCSFIADAKEESINTLIEYGKQRSEGKLKALIATIGSSDGLFIFFWVDICVSILFICFLFI